jgi:hypothetical protein
MEPQERCVHLDKLQREGTSVRSRASRDKRERVTTLLNPAAVYSLSVSQTGEC